LQRSSSKTFITYREKIYIYIYHFANIERMSLTFLKMRVKTDDFCWNTLMVCLDRVFGSGLGEKHLSNDSFGLLFWGSFKFPCGNFIWNLGGKNSGAKFHVNR
jgi:hypothetical protein